MIARTGHFYYADKDDVLWDRVRRRLAALRLADVETYVGLLDDPLAGPREWRRLEGEITVVAFVFTNCQLACPAITANMKIVYSQLEDTPVRFLSISVDPEHDTPEVLRAYADRMSIDTSRWPFLTGEDGEATRVVEESMQFEISDDPDDANIITLDDGSTMRNIRHPIKLFLVGPDRQILDFCAPTLRAERERFTALARKAAE